MSSVLNVAANYRLVEDQGCSLNQVGRVNTTNMGPRRLILCVKVSLVILVLSLTILIITSLSMGHKVLHFSNFHHDSESPPSGEFDEQQNLGLPFDKNAQSDLIKYKYISVDSILQYVKINATFFKLMSSELKSHSECIRTKFSTESNKQVLCLKFDNGINCAVQAWQSDGVKCQSIQWGIDLKVKNDFTKFPLKQCIEMKDNWYGGGALSEHRWPLNRANVPLQPYIVKKYNFVTPTSEGARFLSFLEPYFISSKGVAVVFDSSLPMLISINQDGDKKMCFQSAFDIAVPKNLLTESESTTLLAYKMCKSKSMKGMHEYMLRTNLLNHPIKQPNLKFSEKPVWSTRGIDINNINERELMHYVRDLKNIGLPFDELFIDGNYSRSPGSIYFNEKTFPHSAQLIGELKSDKKKLKIGVEVHPMISSLKQENNFSLRVKTNQNTATNKFDFLDFLNNDAVNWFTTQLNQLSNNVHVSGFRFSGGSFSIANNHAHNQNLPTSLSNSELKNYFQINQASYQYSKIANRFSDGSILGTGFKSQHFGLVTDTGPYISSWEHKKGLKSVIPTVITFGIIGYPFVMAGPIGGIVTDQNNKSYPLKLPDRNLFLRWLQLASFLPVMEFSVGPWQYDTEVVNYTKSLLHYRENTIWPKYLSPALNETVKTGIAIIRPLWWIAPKDTTAQYIDCEFMVGDRLLVAPIFGPKEVSRQVYLPKGSQWLDQLRDGQLLNGGQWLDYHVDEFEIAHFVRVDSQ